MLDVESLKTGDYVRNLDTGAVLKITLEQDIAQMWRPYADRYEHVNVVIDTTLSSRRLSNKQSKREVFK